MKDYLKKFKEVDSLTLTLCIALYYLIGLNFVITGKILRIFSELENYNVFFALSVPLFFFAAFTIIFTPFVSKYIAKPVLIIFLLTSACVNYGAYKFGIIFNQDMMVNIFETTSAEAGSYFNLKLLVWIFLSGILPAFYIAFVKIRYKPFLHETLRKVVLIGGNAILILIIAALFYKDYASVARNNPKLQKDIVPTYYVSSTYKYIKNTYFTEKLPYQEIGTDATREPEDEKYLIVVLVGETARAQNYAYNGYARDTNAYTSQLENIISFKDVSSCGTATAVSLPCMFSLMDKDNYSRQKFDAEDDVIDIIKRTGYKQLWLDNNTGCKGVCRNIESIELPRQPEFNCKGEECTDDIFLKVIDDKIAQMNGEDAVIYMHLIGSHGPTYFQRYPREHAKFQPDCQTSDLSSCSEQEIVNSYDNTILYTDYVMAEVIKRLKNYEDTYHTSLIYMSDHGESLGENGIYLHGMPYAIAPETQTHVPLIMWISDKMVKHEDMDIACMKEKAQSGHFSHDNLAQSLLDILDIESDIVDVSKDIFDSCTEGKS